MDKWARRRLIRRIEMVLVAAWILASFGGNGYAHTEKPDAKFVLKQEMHRLWTGYAFWMRQYIVASIAGDEEVSAIGGRLLRNQDDFGFAVAQFYGIEKSKRFADLLKTHVRITFEVVEAAKIGDKTGLEAANQKWHGNASDIAAFLNELNSSYWPKQCLDDTWDQHLSLTMGQITGRLQKNWNDDTTALDKDFAHILEFAECFAEGIIKQFSSRFYRY